MKQIIPGEELILTVSGSAGLGLSESLDLPFVQEVFAEKIAAQRFCPGTDVIIELGGEDAKILFLTGGFEMRMNGTCAGGTGAFIDQMASLMQITPLELNDLAAKAPDHPAHCLALRRVCQIRHSAASQSGRKA